MSDPQSDPQPNPWIAILGTRETGTHDVLARLGAALAAAGLRLGGLRQDPVFVDGEIVAYELVDLRTGARAPLVRRSRDPEMCEWSFDPDGFATGRAWAADERNGVVALEIGRLEASGRGHWDTIRAALDGPPRLVVLILRPSAAPAALGLSDPLDGIELPAPDDAITAFVDRAAHLAIGPHFPSPLGPLGRGKG